MNDIEYVINRIGNAADNILVDLPEGVSFRLTLETWTPLPGEDGYRHRVDVCLEGTDE